MRAPFLLALALAGMLAVPASDAAAAQTYEVVVVRGLELADLEPLAESAAIGLLVPGAGPRVSGESARAALARGVLRNSLRGGLPEGPVRISYREADTLPPLADRTIVLGLPDSGEGPNDRRYPIAVTGPGFAGLLVSEQTRTPGIVSVTDVAPTALGEADGLRSQPSADPAATLRALDARIADNASSRSLAALAAGLVTLLLAVAFPRAALLALPAVLAVNLLLGVAAISTPSLVLFALTAAAAVAAPALAFVVRSPRTLGLLLAALVAGYLLALGLDGASVALSPLGVTEVSRFYGLSNLLSAMLLVPALAGAALLRATAGWLPAIGAAVLALVAVAGSRFGADGGTAVVLCVAFGVLAVELAEARRRAAFVVVSALAAAVVALVAVDAWTGASSHLTSAAGGGPGGLAHELKERVVLSWERATQTWYTTALVAAGLTVLVAFAWRLLASGLPRNVRALPLALAVATLVSLLVNDSPLDVISIGLVGFLAAQAYVLAEPEAVGGL